jgi:hypothetical protein
MSTAIAHTISAQDAATLRWIDGIEDHPNSFTSEPDPTLTGLLCILYDRVSDGRLSPSASECLDVDADNEPIEIPPDCSPDDSLVEIAGRHAAWTAENAVPGAIYIGTTFSIPFDSEIDRIAPSVRSDSRESVEENSSDHRYQWTLQASEKVILPDGTGRQTDLIDRQSIAAAVVDSRLTPTGHFRFSNLATLPKQVADSLVGFHQDADWQEGFTFSDSIDADTGVHIVEATSKYCDEDLAPFTAVLHFK